MSNGKSSILKLVNYKLRDCEYNWKKVDQTLRYITNPKSTTKELMAFNMVDSDDIVNSFGFFNKAIGKYNGRLIKHLILSYGHDESKVVDWEQCFTAGKEIRDFFGSNYQSVLTVHNNIPTRPHIHMVLGMLDVSNGKKFEQPPSGFFHLRKHVDEVLAKHGIPPLRSKGGEVQTTITAITESQVQRAPNSQQLSNILDGYDLEDAYDNSQELLHKAQKFLAIRQKSVVADDTEPVFEADEMPETVDKPEYLFLQNPYQSKRVFNLDKNDKEGLKDFLGGNDNKLLLNGKPITINKNFFERTDER